MGKFTTKRSARQIELNTSALPDIIFMLLFFFMVVTVLRQQQVLLKIKVPKASEVQKLQHHSLVHHLYVGKPVDTNLGNASRIQVNDAFIDVKEVKGAVEALVSQVPEAKRNLVTTSLKVDKATEMGILNDIKIEIRKAQQYKLNYEALEATAGVYY